MANLAYCPNCKEAKPYKGGKFNWLLFILLLFTGVGWALYLVYYFVAASKKKCKVCGCLIA